jgi:hypothetical protein
MHIAGGGPCELAPSEGRTSNWDDIVSYDLQVWTTRPPGLPSGLPDAALWQEQGGVWIQMRSEWQVVAGPVHRVEPEDVPEAVRALLSAWNPERSSVAPEIA